MNLTSRLNELGLELPAAAAPVASYVPSVRTGNLVFVSGQLPFKDGAVLYPGHLGDTVSTDEGVVAARQCALNVIAHIAQYKVKRVVKLTGFIASRLGYTDQSVVMNGASDLFEAVYGEAGKHSRAAVGVAALPRGAAVEVEAIVEIED